MHSITQWQLHINFVHWYKPLWLHFLRLIYAAFFLFIYLFIYFLLLKTLWPICGYLPQMTLLIRFCGHFAQVHWESPSS